MRRGRYVEALRAWQRGYFAAELRAAGGSVGRLARRAGVDRTNLYRLLDSIGIDWRRPRVGRRRQERLRLWFGAELAARISSRRPSELERRP